MRACSHDVLLFYVCVMFVFVLSIYLSIYKGKDSWHLYKLKVKTLETSYSLSFLYKLDGPLD